jgi:hypothetical protein
MHPDYYSTAQARPGSTHAARASSNLRQRGTRFRGDMGAWPLVAELPYAALRRRTP